MSLINNTTYAQERSPANMQSISTGEFETIYYMILIMIIIATILGNLLVFLAFYANPSLRKPSNYFLFSLAVSDMITAVLILPFEVENVEKKSRWDHGELMCDIWTTLYLVSTPSSIINLSAVAVDRFLCISKPLRYNVIMTTKNSLRVIGAIWIYSLFTALIPQFGYKPSPTSIIYGMCSFNITQEYLIANSILNFVIPPIVMTVLYYRIYQIAKEHAEKISAAERKFSLAPITEVTDADDCKNGSETIPTTGRAQRKFITKNVKAYKKLLVLVLTFYLCWFPYSLLSLIMPYCNACLNIPSQVPRSLLLMGYLNSALNPGLYAFHDCMFRKTYKKICVKMFCYSRH